MEQIWKIISKALEAGASDIHLTVNLPPMMRVNGDLVQMEGVEQLTPEACNEYISSLMNEKQLQHYHEVGEVDFSFVIPGTGRCRVNAYKQRRSFCAAIRLLTLKTPDIDELKLPECLKDYAMRPRGLFLVTGPTGSGKSTTLAAMIDYINRNRKCHVLTIEDPIEYLYKHDKSIINQREVGDDTLTFASALRSALREDPDVILLGEMRDLETMSAAISAAETGHLVLSTLHTTSASQTVDRIIDLFPSTQQNQIKIQLASVLLCVVTQQLIPDMFGHGRVPAFEILVATDAVRNLIREGKTHMIPNVMQTGITQGMMPMDYSLSRLVQCSVISETEAFTRCQDTETLRRYLSFI